MQKTPFWYETRLDLIERIRSNKNLDCIDQWLLYDLSEQLLPFSQGGTWKKELYPGIYEPRRIGIAALEAKNNLAKQTVQLHLNRLEGAGFFERMYYRSDRKMLLVDFRAYPLLASPQSAFTPVFSSNVQQNEVYSDKNHPLINTYNNKNPVIVHLQRRIGCDERMIKNGWLPGQAKYFQPKNALEFDIEKYLAGHRYHQYGSYPLLADGSTWQLDYDFDDSQPWLDEYHRTIQKQLACAGFSSIYAKRRPGRGHLILAFASPVNPVAAHHTLTQVAPALGACSEVYPVGGKRNGKVSWPLYYVIDNKVVESPMVAYIASGSPVESAGYASDKATVERMFATGINSAERIQPIAVVLEDKKHMVATAVAKVSADIDRAIERAAFDACHTVTGVLGMKVNDRFLSPWRYPQEDNPSAVVVSDYLVVDYGLDNNPDGKPHYHGAWDCYQAVQNGLILRKIRIFYRCA